MSEPIREWIVASGLVVFDGSLLLVKNTRRGGHEDWSTPGGVIDADDPDLISGLTRAVSEETGLMVTDWVGPVYTVVATAPDLAWRMRCEVYRATAFRGELVVADPDGIVTEAMFVAPGECESLLAGCPRWVREPLAAWIADRWDVPDTRRFHYEVRGTDRASLKVTRREG